jgi:type IV pilus assembly protein PilE
MKQRQRGVTLIELLTVMVVIAIIASIAIPSYRRYLLRAQRTDARTALLQLQTAEEKFLLQNNTYTSNITAGTGGTPPGLGLTAASEKGFYTLRVTLQTVNNAPGYLLTAVPAAVVGGQRDDTDCAQFTLDEQGQRAALNSSGADNTAVCWK